MVPMILGLISLFLSIIFIAFSLFGLQHKDDIFQLIAGAIFLVGAIIGFK